MTVSLTVDNTYTLYADGNSSGSHDNWEEVKSYVISDATQVVAVLATNPVSIHMHMFELSWFNKLWMNNELT